MSVSDSGTAHTIPTTIAVPHALTPLQGHLFPAYKARPPLFIVPGQRLSSKEKALPRYVVLEGRLEDMREVPPCESIHAQRTNTSPAGVTEGDGDGAGFTLRVFESNQEKRVIAVRDIAAVYYDTKATVTVWVRGQEDLCFTCAAEAAEVRGMDRGEAVRFIRNRSLGIVRYLESMIDPTAPVEQVPFAKEKATCLSKGKKDKGRPPPPPRPQPPCDDDENDDGNVARGGGGGSRAYPSHIQPGEEEVDQEEDHHRPSVAAAAIAMAERLAAAEQEREERKREKREKRRKERQVSLMLEDPPLPTLIVPVLATTTIGGPSSLQTPSASTPAMPPPLEPFAAATIINISDDDPHAEVLRAMSPETLVRVRCDDQTHPSDFLAAMAAAHEARNTAASAASGSSAAIRTASLRGHQRRHHAASSSSVDPSSSHWHDDEAALQVALGWTPSGSTRAPTATQLGALDEIIQQICTIQQQLQQPVRQHHHHHFNPSSSSPTAADIDRWPNSKHANRCDIDKSDSVDGRVALHLPICYDRRAPVAVAASPERSPHAPVKYMMVI